MTVTAKPRILFVDSEQRVLNSMRAMFGREYDLFLTSNGEEALKIIYGSNIDVVVADYGMKGVSGVDVLDWARVRSPHSVRVLIADYTVHDLIKSKQAKQDVFRCLPKPCLPDKLRTAIREAADAAHKLRIAGLESADAGEFDGADTISDEQSESPDNQTGLFQRPVMTDSGPVPPPTADATNATSLSSWDEFDKQQVPLTEPDPEPRNFAASSDRATPLHAVDDSSDDAPDESTSIHDDIDAATPDSPTSLHAADVRDEDESADSTDDVHDEPEFVADHSNSTDLQLHNNAAGTDVKTPLHTTSALTPFQPVVAEPKESVLVYSADPVFVANALQALELRYEMQVSGTLMHSVECLCHEASCVLLMDVAGSNAAVKRLVHAFRRLVPDLFIIAAVTDAADEDLSDLASSDDVLLHSQPLSQQGFQNCVKVACERHLQNNSSSAIPVAESAAAGHSLQTGDNSLTQLHSGSIKS